MLTMVAHIWNLSTQEVETGGSRIGSQDGHHTKTLYQRQMKMSVSCGLVRHKR